MNKYKAKKIETEYGTFDSKKEAKRFLVLKELERKGEIYNLQRQVRYELIPVQKEPDKVGIRGGRKPGKVYERECAYIADFVYGRGNETIVEDVKGYRQGGAYAVFVIKRKLMLYRYGLKVREV